MNNDIPIPLHEGDFVIHPDYNRGLTTYIEHISRDNTYAIIRDIGKYVCVPLTELKRYIQEDF